MSRNILITSIVAVFLGIGIFFVYKWKSNRVSDFKVDSIDVAKEIKTKNRIIWIGVLTGNEFDIKLSDGRRIHAFLPMTATPEAKDKVVKLITEARIPHVILYEFKDDKWIIELVMTIEGKEIKLSDWLKKNKLVWEK